MPAPTRTARPVHVPLSAREEQVLKCIAAGDSNKLIARTLRTEAAWCDDVRTPAVEFQLRTEDMHAVAEAGIAAHWMYKASAKDSGRADEAQRLGAMWLQSLIDALCEVQLTCEKCGVEPI